MSDARRIAELEAELAALRAEMQNFTYTVSHDLRAPLRHIVSYAQMVQEDAAPLLPEETRGFLNTITESAHHLGALLDGLAELSRLGTGAVQTSHVALQPLVQDIVDGLAHAHPQRAVAWQVQAEMPLVIADATLLRKALACVLDNALKFTANQEAAQITVSATVLAGSTQAVPDAGATVLLTVQDNGAGYNPAMQDKLFKPFGRLHTTRQFPGIGMGLPVTRKALERMGGTVQLDATVLAGCTVRISLPALKTTA